MIGVELVGCVGGKGWKTSCVCCLERSESLFCEEEGEVMMEKERWSRPLGAQLEKKKKKLDHLSRPLLGRATNQNLSLCS